VGRVIDSSLRAGELGYKFNKTEEGKLPLRIERMNRVSREDEDVREQEAVSFPVPQFNNGLHPTANSTAFTRKTRMIVSLCARRVMPDVRLLLLFQAFTLIHTVSLEEESENVRDYLADYFNKTYRIYS
jgi:hypothetical protein